MKSQKQTMRCNININALETRIINILKGNASEQLEKHMKDVKGTFLFVGSGRSYAGAYFASRVINDMYGITTLTLPPREVLYRNNMDITKTFLFSYSGTTSDLLEGTKKLNDKIIITKAKVKKVLEKTNILKENVISYYSSNNRHSEKGHLFFDDALTPASLFYKIYAKNHELDAENFIIEQTRYWGNFFAIYFMYYKDTLKDILRKNSTITLFRGDYTDSAAIDLESKIIDSGLYRLNIHEKKNFSHGRFTNMENQKSNAIIYFKQRETSDYEGKLLSYLFDKNVILIESKFNGISAEFDLLIASQYFLYYVANLLDIDVYKSKYSKEALELYFYKGKL